MKYLCTLPIALALLVGITACGDTSPGPDGPNGGVESRWGFLNDASLVPTSPQFLVNKSRGEKYRVCLPGYMATAFPGIDAEIDAAVNIWAAYLGRSIPVEVVVKDLPRARPDQTIDALGTAYEVACGEGFDVVMGLAKIEGDAVGLTGAGYSYVNRPDGTRQITSFARYLFLRDYDLLPTVGGDGVAERWTSLAAQEGASIAPDILAKMLTRASTSYARAGTYLILPVLTHEYGHVWGLCDQYERSTNCDPRNSSSHPVEASIMGARGGTQRLFLTDDDIEGVRALASKPGFAHDWGAPRMEPPLAIPHKPVELARIENVHRDGTDLLIDYGVVTTGAARYEFFLQAANQPSFTALTSGFGSAESVDTPTGRLTIAISGISAAKYRVKMVVTPQTGDPVTVVGGEL